MYFSLQISPCISEVQEFVSPDKEAESRHQEGSKITPQSPLGCDTSESELPETKKLVIL